MAHPAGVRKIGDQKGISVAELLLVVFLISILAIIIIPRFSDVSQDAKYEACRTNAANINALVQLFYIKEGTWPRIDLSDVESNVNYFPEGSLPDCPVTSVAAYFIYPTGHRVSGHARGVPTHP